MAVLGAAPRRIGGLEMFARELARQLNHFGWRAVFCFLEPPPPPVRRFLALPNVSLEVLEGAISPDLRTVLELVRLLARHRPEVVHLHFTSLLTPCAWVARACLARRVFFTDHCSRDEGFIAEPAPAAKRVLGRLITLPVTCAIGVSNYVAQCDAARGYVPPSKIRCIYNGVDLARVSSGSQDLRRKYRIPGGRRIIVQTSWLLPEKGIPDVLETARLVLAEEPEAHFVIAGDGEYQEQYMASARDMGIEANVTWAGLVGDPLGEGLFAAADIICQLSRWEEAFGWAIIEGMACRKPVVATAVGGIPEIIEDGRCGFLVPRRCPDKAAERILRLLRDPALRERMGAAGRQAVELRFNLERNVAELVKLYKICTKIGE
jgi:glycosyltransferase involved in cell wall biosynthesis